MLTGEKLMQHRIKNACADEMNFRQIVLAEFGGVAALRQEFCGRKMAEMQPSARVGFVRCYMNFWSGRRPTEIGFGWHAPKLKIGSHGAHPRAVRRTYVNFFN
jgi:hypothetical protein